jgi:hypothetical protein
MSKIKTVIVNSLSYGFVTGFCVGCFPNTLVVKFEDKKYKPPIPIISGLICSVGLIVSPLLIINYFGDGVYFDKVFDKYHFNIERYHQYDGKNNKYAYPSLIILSITPKNETIKWTDIECNKKH